MAKRFLTPIDLTGTVNENIPAPERSIKWSDGEGSLEIGLKGGSVKLSVGQEEVALCYNGTGSTLTNGTVVYVSGVQGQRPSISKASALTETTSSKTFGIVTEDIESEQEGFVATFGIVRNINTSNFSPGDALWLSTTSGSITSTMPAAPNHAVFVGYCLKSHASAGQIFVKIQNGYELEELHNVLITNPNSGDALKYNSFTGLWENAPVEGGVFEVFYQDEAPSSAQLGDIWIESDVDVPEYDAIDLSLYATKSSPTFTGTPLAPTAPPGTNTTQIATTAFVQEAAIAAAASLIDSAPETLDTLNELAAAINDDANFFTTVATNLSNHESDTTNIHGISDTSNLVYTNDSRLSDSRTPISHASSHGETGNDSITISQSQVTNLNTDLSSKAPLDSPALTGVPTTPTASAGTNTTQIASTEYVRTEISNLVSSAPETLDTLSELASALGNDANFATTVANSLAGKESSISAGTTDQYWRGDKTWQTLDKTAVGLSNVENVALSTWTGSSSINTVGTLSSLTVTGLTTTYVTTNIQTGTSYTLVLSDSSKLVEINNSSANTITVPTNSSAAFPIGTKIDILQSGLGQTTIVGDSGVTINSFESNDKLSGQWAAATLIKRGTDVWALIGSITS